MSDYILEFKNVSKYFPGVRALDNVSFGLQAGRVHALCGENGAGKSTLMKCLIGLYTMDQGEIFMEGQPVKFKDIKDARDHGLSIIPQELAPITERSVMENIWLNCEPMKFKFFVDHKKIYAETKKILQKFNLDIDPKRLMKDLTVAQSQMVDIIKAVSFGAKIIMMDEPTSALTNREIQILFGIIRNLTASGIAIVYVTHKMDEVMAIADEVTVLRDGKWVSTHNIEETSASQIIRDMVGREIKESYYDDSRSYGGVILKADGISAQKAFSNISFELHKGEVLGIAGLVGAGRTELLETIFGLRRMTKGQLYLNGEPFRAKDPNDAINHGITLLTEERRRDGIFSVLSVAENILVANYGKYVDRFGFVNTRGIDRVSEEYIKLLNIKTPDIETKIENLSGGNQQKVLLARWWLSDPEILLLDEPTRGIDVGAKAEIYSIIVKLAGQGKSILVVSSEMPELIKICDRIMVMHEGCQTGILEHAEFDQNRIMELAAAKVDKLEETL